MIDHPYFDIELDDRPDTSQFELVLPWSRVDCAYSLVNYSDDLCEGIITLEDITELLRRLSKIPLPLRKTQYFSYDALVILGMLIAAVALGLGAFFTIGFPFKGGREALVIVPAAILLLLLIGFSVSCLLRIRVNKSRLPILKEVIQKAQDEIFTPKAAILFLSPFESYIIIELCWKYSRVHSLFESKQLTDYQHSTSNKDSIDDENNIFEKVTRELATQKYVSKTKKYTKAIDIQEEGRKSTDFHLNDSSNKIESSPWNQHTLTTMESPTGKQSSASSPLNFSTKPAGCYEKTSPQLEVKESQRLLLYRDNGSIHDASDYDSLSEGVGLRNTVNMNNLLTQVQKKSNS